MSVALSLTECAIESVPRFRMALIFSLLESEVHPAMAFRFRSPLCVPSCCVTLYFGKKVSGEGQRKAGWTETVWASGIVGVFHFLSSQGDSDCV